MIFFCLFLYLPPSPHRIICFYSHSDLFSVPFPSPSPVRISFFFVCLLFFFFFFFYFSILYTSSNYRNRYVQTAKRTTNVRCLLTLFAWVFRLETRGGVQRGGESDGWLAESNYSRSRLSGAVGGWTRGGCSGRNTAEGAGLVGWRNADAARCAVASETAVRRDRGGVCMCRWRRQRQAAPSEDKLQR